jgi:hypothetical protein
MKESRVDVANETAVIIWDEQSKTEHFIRSASFTSTSPDFGFLVPTPTKPELAEASPEIYTRLGKLTEPRTVVETRTASIGCGAGSTAASHAGAATSSPVQVLERKRVGALDAAVLRADDAGKLRGWLADHGYDARPELQDWLKAYVRQGWVITAFKIAGDAKPAKDAPANAKPYSVSGPTVRMSFHTERPFFPYREPADQGAAATGLPPRPRLLRVYFLADARFAGTLGDGSRPWPGETVWANRIEPAQFEAAARSAHLPPEAISTLAPRGWWLTEFEDRSSPRPGTDEVYFGRSEDQSAVERPPSVRYEYREWPIWLGLTAICGGPVLFLIAVAWLIWRLLRKPRLK